MLHLRVKKFKYKILKYLKIKKFKCKILKESFQSEY